MRAGYASFTALLGAAALASVAAAAAPAAPAPDRSGLYGELLRVLNSGDEEQYRRFVRLHYAPESLKDGGEADEVSTLAKIYTDTGGLSPRGSAPAETADATYGDLTDRTLHMRYCLRVGYSEAEGRSRIAAVSLRGKYPAGADLSDPAPQEVASAVAGVARAFEHRGLFSGVVLVAKGPRVVFEHAYGDASPAFGVAMTPATRLNAASIGKSITGVAIGQLVDAGRLSYDDTVGRWLPDFPDPGVRAKVTVRQLLSHTSGLGPDDYYDDPRWDSMRFRLHDVASYMQISRDAKIGAPPGQYLYSNTGYVILGAIIEKATGQSFYDYVQRHIFDPAGMTASFYHALDAEDRDVAEPLTNAYPSPDGRLRFRLGPPRNAIFELAARGGPQGGVFTTARDLFRFDQALRAGRLVSPGRFAEMTTPVSPAGAGAPGLTGEVREGLGFEVIRQNGHRLIGHTGGDFGVASFTYVFPDSDYTVIALTNRDPRAARVLTNVSRSLLTRRLVDGAPAPPERCENSF